MPFCFILSETYQFSRLTWREVFVSVHAYINAVDVFDMETTIRLIIGDGDKKVTNSISNKFTKYAFFFLFYPYGLTFALLAPNAVLLTKRNIQIQSNFARSVRFFSFFSVDRFVN